jgi:diguanylate cyclase (GGDEF)-like protein
MCKFRKIKDTMLRVTAIQKGYFIDSKEEIAARNLRLMSMIGYAGIILYIAYLLVTAIFFKKWLISPLYGLIVPVLGLFLLYSRKTTRSGAVNTGNVQKITMLLYVTLMAYVLIMSVFPHPNVPSVYYPLFLLMAPVIFILPVYQHLIMTMISLGVFYVLVFRFKSPVCWPHELFEATTSAVFSLLVIEFMTQFRIQTDSLKEKYYRLSRQDALTGVANKNTGLESAQEYIDKMWRKEAYALLFIDIDCFKLFNDTFGHLEGDKMLKRISDTLTSLCRKNDAVCRFGGDEFIILLKDVPNVHIAEQKAQDIIDSVSQIKTKSKFQMSCSIGVCYCSQDCATIEEAIRRADIALYHAKNSGKSCFTVYVDPSAQPTES